MSAPPPQGPPRREYPRAARPATAPPTGGQPPGGYPPGGSYPPAGAYPPAYRPQAFAPEPAVRGTLNAAYAPPPNTTGPIEQVWTPGQRTSNRLVFNVVIYVGGGLARLIAPGYIALAPGPCRPPIAFPPAPRPRA